MRLVIVSFAFMGFAFYELSGGADFEPRGVRGPKPEPVAQAPSAETPPVRIASSAPELVSEPVIEPQPTTRPVQPTTPEPEASDALTRLAQVNVISGSDSLFQTPAEDTVTLASLQEGLLSAETVTDAQAPEQPLATTLAEPQRDIREITGTRVNMRDGPGTIYPVITRLNIGHQVEVLDSSGTGWLRLRVLPERQIGWIAASLVSKNAN
ncbi:SH3 domain-containing protein [Ruegeria sp. 2012CJ41-6]|uniref:SH3 domain-containing protein n=1 Tax=Ruegeria spongiae TaxID=2942209 RepID=A0ABT0Q435_9RHOB|nr:SH3 domain-containing protein [Ruegeria spongiae]MCL6284598.1 SH3 domain-containing protein [Ruegeria spongiae]